MKTSFSKWLDDYEQGFRTSVAKDIEKQFGEFEPGTYLEEVERKSWDKKSLQLYVAYRTEVTTKRLVLATWVLAIGTLVLSGLTLFLTFLT